MQESYTDFEDSVKEKEEEKSENSLFMSLRFEMCDDTPTRAAGDNLGFEDGTIPPESDIKNFLVLFFKSDGTQCNFSLDETSPVKVTTDGEYGLAEEIEWGSTVLLELLNEDGIFQDEAALGIDKFVTIVNYDTALKNSLSGKNLSEIYSLTRPDYKTDNGFLMTTAGHYNTDGNYVYYNSLNEDPDQKIFYAGEKEAKAHPVTVYVERLAARIDFEIDTSKIHPFEVIYGTDIYNLTFDPKYLGVTATEKSNFLLKHLQVKTNTTYSSSFPSDFSTWIDYKNKRVFWAESVNFNVSGSYPAEMKSSTSNCTLKYPAFREITNGLTESNGKKTTTIYTFEHTFKNTELTASNTKNPYAVPTSIVPYGVYVAKCIGTDLVPPAGESLPSGAAAQIGSTLDFSTGGFYLREIDMERVDNRVLNYRLYLKNSSSDELFDALLKEQYVIWVAKKDKSGNVITNADGTPIGDYPVKAEDGLSIFELVNTFRRYENGNFTDAYNEYTLQLKSSVNNRDLLYAEYDATTKTGKFSYLTLTGIDKANKMLQQQLGSCQYFDKGYAFFYAPVPHYSGSEDPFKSSGYKGEFNYSNGKVNHKTADFGLVRNHIYNFSVSSLSGIGFGKTNDNYIPLPELRQENTKYIFDIQLEILPWHVYKYEFDI